MDLPEIYESVKTVISSTAYALLWYDTMKANYHQEGFLIGEIHEQASQRITDSENPVTDIKKSIEIHTWVPCPHVGYFYEGNGKVNFEKVSRMLGNLSKKVVGFYKYKSFVDELRPTFRETLIHNQLATDLNCPKDMFVLCLLTMQKPKPSTFVHRIEVYRMPRFIKFKKVPVIITTMGNLHNDFRSKRQPSEAMNNILEEAQIEAEFFNEKFEGYQAIQRTLGVLVKRLQETAETLIDAEKKLFDLEAEVAELRQRKMSRTRVVHLKHFSKQQESEEDSDESDTNDENSSEKCSQHHIIRIKRSPIKIRMVKVKQISDSKQIPLSPPVILSFCDDTSDLYEDNPNDLMSKYVELPLPDKSKDSVYDNWSNVNIPSDFNVMKGHLGTISAPVEPDVEVIKKQSATCTCTCPPKKKDDKDNEKDNKQKKSKNEGKNKDEDEKQGKNEDKDEKETKNEDKDKKEGKNESKDGKEVQDKYVDVMAAAGTEDEITDVSKFFVEDEDIVNMEYFTRDERENQDVKMDLDGAENENEHDRLEEVKKEVKDWIFATIDIPEMSMVESDGDGENE